MAGDPVKGAGDLRRSLDFINGSLEEATRRLAGEARPQPAELEALGRVAGELREALLAVAEAADDLPEDDRLQLLRQASVARSRLAVVATLVTGGARFAALMRELAAPTGGVIYGRGGAGPRSAASPSVERKA